MARNFANNDTRHNTGRPSQGSILRVTLALFLAQALSAAAYSTTSSINSFAFIELSGQKALAGVPLTLVLVGSAFANYVLGPFIQRRGRRLSLVLGGLMGSLGALFAGVGVITANMLIYLPGMILLGAGRGILDQSRYAAAEVYPPSQRARAISIVVWGATIGAVLGSTPAVVVQLTNWAASLGLNVYSGPIFATSALFFVIAIMLFVLMAVDLNQLSRDAQAIEMPHVATSTMTAGVVTAATTPAGPAPQRSFWDILHIPDARAASFAMICGQAAMVFAMGVIGVHMMDHGHALGDISTVQTTHVLGMFALSPLIGILGDRLGRKPVIALGALLLAAGCILAPLSLYTPWIALAQFCVGLGWSGCYVSGSALLTDTLGATERARLQSTNDALNNIASAAGGLSGGILLNALGFGIVSTLGLMVALVPLIVLVQAGFGRPKTAEAV